MQKIILNFYFMEKNILVLNDFINYDCNKEKFIVKKHIIEIPEMEFSFDDLKGWSKNSVRYKWFMNKINLNWKIWTLKQSRQLSRWRSNWNWNWRDYKKNIERFIIWRLWINKIFDIFSTEDMSLSLKKKKD